MLNRENSAIISPLVHLLDIVHITDEGTHTHPFNSPLSGLCFQCFDAVGWAAGRASGL